MRDNKHVAYIGKAAKGYYRERSHASITRRTIRNKIPKYRQ